MMKTPTSRLSPLLIGISILSPWTASAGDMDSIADPKAFGYSKYCEGVALNPVNSPLEVRPGVLSDGVTPKMTEAFFRQIQKSFLLHQGALAPQPKLVANFKKVWNNAFYSPLEASLNVPIQFATAVKAPNGEERMSLKPPSYLLPVFSHEYGHSVFSRNITIDGCPVSRVLQGLFEEHKALEAEAQSPDAKVSFHAVDDLFLSAGVSGIGTISEVDGARIERLRSLGEATVLNAMKLIALRRIPSTPLNELFADVLAFFATGDPEAIGNSLRSPGQSDARRRHASLRNFNSRPSMTYRELGGPAGTLKPSDALFKNVGDYESLNPLRNHLWKHYLSVGAYQKKAKAFLVVFIQIAQRELDRARSDLSAYETEKFQAVNQRLIEAFDRELPRVLK